jgi:hypothetical protein
MPINQPNGYRERRLPGEILVPLEPGPVSEHSPSGAYSVQSIGARHFSENGDYPAKCFMSDVLNSQVVHQNFSGDVPLHALTLSPPEP